METKTSLCIDHLDPADIGALYCHYSRQSQPQDCYIALDLETGDAWADYNGEIGNAVPSDVWHNRTLRWGIPILQAQTANELLDSLAPLFERILAGASVEWDGHNNVGRLDEGASDAEAEIDARLNGMEGDFIYVLDAGDWLSPAEPAIRNLHAAGASLDEIVTEFQGRGTGEGDEYIDGIESVIREIIEGA